MNGLPDAPAAFDRPDVSLRPVAMADVPLLRRWDSAPHIEEATGRKPGEPGAWDWENEIAEAQVWREMFIAEHRGRPVGFVQIMDPHEEPTAYWGACGKGVRAIDIWIGEADCLRRGIGTQMMRLALTRCFAVPDVGEVLIDPLSGNDRAIAFYKSLGFLSVGRQRFGDDDCLVMRIRRDDFMSGRRGPR